MSRLTRLFGILSPVFLLLGTAAGFIVGFEHLYTVVHFAIGGVLLASFLISNASQLPALFAGRATRQLSYTASMGVLLAVTLIAANYMVYQNPRSYDLSKDQLFTLSEQTLQVLDKLDVEVKAWVFIPGGDAGGAGDLLRQYAYRSEYFSFKAVDPEVDFEMVQKFDLNGSEPILVLEAGLRNVKVKQIAEEKITKALIELEGGVRRKAYILTEHGEPDLADEKSERGAKLLVRELMAENFEVLPLNLIHLTQVPEDADVLIIMGIQHQLIPEEVRQIQRYMKFGGSVLVLTDPGYVYKLAGLLDPLGIAPQDSVIIDQQVRLFAGPTVGVQLLNQDYGSHPIVQPLKGMRTTFELGCSLDIQQVDGVQTQELIRSNPSSWAEFDIQRLLDTGEVVQGEDDRAGPVPIAAAAEGYAAPGTQEPPLIGTAKTVVICDSDFVHNKWLGQFANLDLVLNAVTWLAGNETEVTIRPKARSMSSLTLTVDEMTNIFFLCVLIFPELLLISGLIVWWRRR